MAKSAIMEESGVQKQKGKVLYPLFFSVFFLNSDFAYLLLILHKKNIVLPGAFWRRPTKLSVVVVRKPLTRLS